METNLGHRRRTVSKSVRARKGARRPRRRRFESRGRHGNGNRGNNRGDRDKSREQSDNIAVMGFRIIRNTAGIKLINATDVATGEALPNKTA